MLVLLLLAGCQIVRPNPQPSPSALPSNTPEGTSTPIPPSPTITHTPLPTATSTPTPLPTPTPTSIVLAAPGTALPGSLPPISFSNAYAVSGLANFSVANVTDMEWAPNGSTLAVASYDDITIFDASSRQPINVLDTRPGVISIDYNPQGSLLAVGNRYGSEEEGYAGSVDVWRVSSWQPLGPILAGSQAVSQVAFSPNGRSLASAFTSAVYETNRVVFWDAVGWEISRTLSTGAVLGIAFSPDGKLLASSPDRYAVEIYRLLDGLRLQAIHTSFTGAVNCMAFSPNGTTLATGHYDGEIRLWNALTGDLLGILETGAVVNSLAYNPDGTLLAAGMGVDSNSVQLWDVEVAELLRTMDEHAHPVVSVAFSPDGSILASGSFDGAVWLWGIRP